MHKLILAGFISSILVFGVQCDGIPDCDFFDTVNLTGSLMLPNGSYKYKDLSVPAHLTGDYDYVINPGGERTRADPHTRGCVCKLRPCIRLCCHRKKLMAGDLRGCFSYINETLTYDYELNVAQSDGQTVVKRHILKDMIVQEDLPLPCREHYDLYAEEVEADKWTLFENGSLFRHFDAKHLSKQEYCLQPNKSSTRKDYIRLVAFNCIIEQSMATAYVKLCSVFFMSLTILIYLWLPKFQSLHGRTCNLYFICLTFTFLLNVFSMFRIFEDITPLCLINGYVGYFMVLATFLWLSVISFDVWRRFAMRRLQDFYNNGRSSFFNYNVIVWSTAGTLTLLIMLVDQFAEFNEDKPNTPAVGKFSCWINTNYWSAMIYLYSPLAILIILNGVMFCLTTRCIYVENKNNQKVLNRSEQQKQSRNRANYRVFLRLFIIMGGSWFLEIIGFVCEMESVFQPIITLNDVLNCSQGIIIFLATFCNRDMMRSINQRIQDGESMSTDFSSSSRPQEKTNNLSLS